MKNIKIVKNSILKEFNEFKIISNPPHLREFYEKSFIFFFFFANLILNFEEKINNNSTQIYPNLGSFEIFFQGKVNFYMCY